MERRPAPVPGRARGGRLRPGRRPVPADAARRRRRRDDRALPRRRLGLGSNAVARWPVRRRPPEPRPTLVATVPVSTTRIVDIAALAGRPGGGRARRASSRWRLPPELAPLARIALDYRWAWDPDGPELFRVARPARVGAQRPKPRAPARGPDAARGRRSRPRDGADARARSRGSRRCSRRTARVPRRRSTGLDGPVVFVCAEFGDPPVAADLLGRARRARGRHPQGRRATSRCRWSASGCSTARGTSSSASTAPGSSTSTGRRSCPSASRPCRCSTRTARRSR